MKGILWAARALSAGVLGLLATFVVGEGMPHGLAPNEARMMAALGVTAAGLAAGWFRPAIGGALALAGSIAFYGLNYAASGRLPGGPVFPLFPIAAVLFLLAGWKGKGSDSGFRRPDPANMG